MVRASFKSVASLLFAACLVAAALAFVGVSPAYAADGQVTVTVKVNMPLGVVDVAEGDFGADAGSADAGYSDTITLQNVDPDKGGMVDFAARATEPFGCIESITITCDGKTYEAASCKEGDPADGFYDVSAGYLNKDEGILYIDHLGSASYPNVTYPSAAPGESYKRYASFTLSHIESDVTIEVDCDLTSQQTVTFHRNYDPSDSDTLKTPYYRHYGEQLGAAPAVPAHEGYTFLGWATSPDGEPAEWDPEALMYDKSLNFYAIWQANEEAEPLPPADGEEENDGNNNDSPEKNNAAPSEDEAPALAKTGDDMTALATAAAMGALASLAVAGAALARARQRSER